MRSPPAPVPSRQHECAGRDEVPAVDGTPTGSPSVDAAAAAAAVNGRGGGGAHGLRRPKGLGRPPPRPTAPSSSSSNSLRSGDGVTAARSTAAADTGFKPEVSPKTKPAASPEAKLEVMPEAKPEAPSPMAPSRATAPRALSRATSPMAPSWATARRSLSHGAVSGGPSSALARGAMALSGLLSAGRNAVRESHASESAPSSTSYRCSSADARLASGRTIGADGVAPPPPPPPPPSRAPRGGGPRRASARASRIVSSLSATVCASCTLSALPASLRSSS